MTTDFQTMNGLAAWLRAGRTIADTLAWNRYRENNRGWRPDLRGANLAGADLRGLDLSGAKLGGANLGGV